jgi:hypothetical protein
MLRYNQFLRIYSPLEYSIPSISRIFGVIAFLTIIRRINQGRYLDERSHFRAPRLLTDYSTEA